MSKDVSLEEVRNAKEKLEEAIGSAIETAVDAFAKEVDGMVVVTDLDVVLTPYIDSADYRARSYVVGVEVEVRL